MGTARKVALVSLSALAAVLLSSVLLVAARGSGPQVGAGGGAQPPPDMLVFRPGVSAALAPTTAFADGAYVAHTADGSEHAPVAWVLIAASQDAAVFLVQLDEAGTEIAIAGLERDGATWSGGGAALPAAERCTPPTAPEWRALCAFGHGTRPGSPTPETWDWTARDGTLGEAVRFAAPLVASSLPAGMQPPSPGEPGATSAALVFDDKRFSVVALSSTHAGGSANATAQATTIVAVGTASAGALTALVTQLSGA